MQKLIKILFILNYIFWSGFFFWSFILLIGYNGLFNLFPFSCQNAFDIHYNKVRNIYIVEYSYTNGFEKIQTNERVSKEIFISKIRGKKYLEICYNSKFPKLSYIKDLNLGVYRNMVSLVTSISFLIFFFIIDLLVEKNYWINKYKKFFYSLRSFS